MDRGGGHIGVRDGAGPARAQDQSAQREVARGNVVYLADRQPRRERAAGKAEGERRRIYDPCLEAWTDWPDPVSACRARSHRSITAFERACQDREFPRFVGKLKGDAGRDPLNSLCQFGAVCAATQAGFFALSVTAITFVAFVPFYQLQMLRHAASLQAPHRMEKQLEKKFGPETENVRH